MPIDPNQLILVSVDDHVVEPADMFEGRLPAEFADRAPRVIERPDGREMWLFEGMEIPNFGLNAVSGRPQEEFGIEPTRFDEIRTGTYQVADRIADMNAGGVLGSLNFPSFPQFCGQIFANTADKELALAVLRAYNDWHVEEWAGGAPGRIIPLGLVPYWDPQLMAAEVHRLADRGVRAVTFSENPDKLGVPDFHSDHWDPFWRACDDREMVICLHIGSSSAVKLPSLNSPFTAMLTLQPTSVMDTASDLMWSTIPARFPKLKFCLSEGGIGWIPYLLERADYVYKNHSVWTGTDLGGRLPSEVFAEHFICCFISDRTGTAQLGPSLAESPLARQTCIEVDYPHSDSTWPNAPEVLAEQLDGLDPDIVEAVTHANALRFFGFDPFAHRAPGLCTAGALRAEAAGVNVGPEPLRQPFQPPERPVSLMDLLSRAEHPLLDEQAEREGANNG